ncbi:unnamed protein product [Penicillium salamii]|uniref:Exonuclease domain-containing protein n=1 Tax=Penicillium salamii TaxID=1612424 RepID=A0A9W4J884_9EURO|nr:unnamed protein product [Penicillium salamii]CAG8239551.1 unnamed protein product [Penicillium salamii]CAG8245952.1 unnamed protein product [Penicillium salamii]CAG8259141.1 unnamed protein product [Penicillium salamii]CAG8267920.1 unnamed protein product [Penicillium salamii]
MRISTIAPFDSTIPPFDPTIAIFDPMQMDRAVVLDKLLDFSHYGPRLEAEGYRLHTIYPPKFCNSTIPCHQYRYSPIVPRDTPGIRAVLVVDCEVVKTKNNRRMLASVSAIDFFTKEILVNSLVEPAGEVVDWLSHQSGMSQRKMKSARRSGTIMQNWQDAREEVWKFMDPKTILIGHTLVQSLEVLGIMHGNIVDTAIVTSEAVLHPASQDEQLARKWSLRVLSKEFLKIEIQTKATGHTSLLDTFAIRNVIIRCIADEKGLRAWAENASIENQQGLTRRMKKSKLRLEKWKALKKAECKKRAQIDTKEGPEDNTLIKSF